jgi:hypothetical protein
MERKWLYAPFTARERIRKRARHLRFLNHESTLSLRDIGRLVDAGLLRVVVERRDVTLQFQAARVANNVTAANDDQHMLEGDRDFT